MSVLYVDSARRSVGDVWGRTTEYLVNVVDHDNGHTCGMLYVPTSTRDHRKAWSALPFDSVTAAEVFLDTKGATR